MASLRNRSERLMGLRPLFMLIWLHIPPRSGWFSGLASPVLHVSPLVRIHTKSAIYSSTSDPFRGTLHRTTVLPSALPPRNRRNIRASGRFCIVSGAIKYRDIEANTVTAFQYSFRCRFHRTGNASFYIWERFWHRKNAPRSTWKQPRFGAFFRVFLLVVSCLFCLRISFAQGQLLPLAGTSGLPLDRYWFFPNSMIPCSWLPYSFCQSSIPASPQSSESRNSTRDPPSSSSGES